MQVKQSKSFYKRFCVAILSAKIDCSSCFYCRKVALQPCAILWDFNAGERDRDKAVGAVGKVC